MAIGVKVDPRIIATGNVVAVQERTGWVSPDDKAKGIVGDVERHDVLLSQGDGGQLVVRYRVRDKLELPQPGSYLAVEARVSEGSMRRDDGTEMNFVSLVAVAPAFGALDAIHSALSAK